MPRAAFRHDGRTPRNHSCSLPGGTGVGCIYGKNLDAVVLGVLEEIIAASYAALTAGTYTKRAREGGQT